MLNRYGISLPQEETERVDTLRYTWDKLLSLAVSNYAENIFSVHQISCRVEFRLTCWKSSLNSVPP